MQPEPADAAAVVEPAALPLVARPSGAALRVLPVEGVISLSVGEEHACVARADGRVLCWGNGATYRLGTGIAEASKAPLLVPTVDHALRVAAGGAVSCAIRQDATVLCWGGYRQTSDDEDGIGWPMVRMPQVVAQPVAWTKQVTAGWTQASFLDPAGGVSILDAYVGPVPLAAFAPAVALASLSDGFCALTREGRVQCVTSSESGATGNGGNNGGFGEEPATVLAPIVWRDELHKVFFDDEGNQVWAPCSRWRDPDAVEQAPDTRPSLCTDELTGASAIDAQGDFACAVLTDGGLACWGCAHCFDTHAPPLGMPPGVVSSVPFRLPGMTNVVSVAVGGRHLCTLHKDGAVRCWGDDFEGQLGPAGRGTSATPTLVPGLGEVVAIDAGEATTCALRKDKTVVCWGHVLGTVLAYRPSDDEASDYENATALVTERALPEGLAGVAPLPTLVCRDIDVFDRDGGLAEVQYRYDRKGRLLDERHLSWNGTTPELTSTATYTRDAKGRVTRTVRSEVRDGGDIYESSMRYRYDRDDKVVWSKAGARVDDSIFKYAWDDNGRLVSMTPSWGGKIVLEWRERTGAPGTRFAGLRLNESATDAERLPGEEPVTVRYALDAQGRTVYRRVSDAERAMFEYWTTYDEAGHELIVRQASYADGFYEDPLYRREIRYTYGPSGQREETQVFAVDADPVTGGDKLTLVTHTRHLHVGCL